ncbi:MAG TPA: PhnA-like protein [Hyphomicrobiaceae bacterium]|nr:PhnA-like protein [Hyphomicrobiaceae bacterium]
MDGSPDREGQARREGNGHAEQRAEVLPTTPDEDMRTVLIHRVTWSAVFAGVALSLVTQLLLNMLGMGIGVGVFDPQGGLANQLSNISMGAAIWWAVSGIIAAAMGGYAAGRLCGQPEPTTAAWHGLTSWAFATIAVTWLFASTVSMIVGGTANTAATAAGGGQQQGTIARTVAPGLTAAAQPFTGIEQQIRADAGDPGAARDYAVASVHAFLMADQANAAQARDRAVFAVSRAMNIPPDQAAARVTAYEQQYRQAASRTSQTATQTADTAARAVSWSMIGATIALLLGAMAAWWAGRSAAIDPTITAIARRVRTRGVAA